MRAQALKYLRFMPIIGIGLIFAAFFYFHAYNYLSLHTLKNNQYLLQHWVNGHYILSSVCFTMAFVMATTCAVPWSSIFVLTSGILFGIGPGGIYSLIGATGGAILLFLAVRYAFDDWITRKAGHKIQKFQQEFQTHSSIYLLVVRLIPIMPFSLVNILAPLADVKLSTFIITTFIGIIPETFLYALLGHNIGRLENNTSSSLVFSSSFILPIAGLCALMIFALFYQQYKRKKQNLSIQPI